MSDKSHGDDLRKKLAARMRGEFDAKSPPVVYRRDLPHAQRRTFRPPAGPVAAIDFAQATGARESTAPNGETAWVIENALADLPGGWGQLCEKFRGEIARAGSRLGGCLRDAGDATDVRCEDLIFVDLETTGLGSAMTFLIGTMVWQPRGFVVRQFFARDYSQERAILSLYFQAAADKKMIVSFNGKSFDVPLLRVRAAAGAVRGRMPAGHLDLLHVSRRIWRGQFADCRLQTLERRVCGRSRTDDIPGALIPEAYHAFVRTGHAGAMVKCVKHNRLDLMTLADLMTRLPAGEAQPRVDETDQWTSTPS